MRIAYRAACNTVIIIKLSDDSVYYLLTAVTEHYRYSCRIKAYGAHICRYRAHLAVTYIYLHLVDLAAHLNGDSLTICFNISVIVEELCNTTHIVARNNSVTSVTVEGSDKHISLIGILYEYDSVGTDSEMLCAQAYAQ